LALELLRGSLHKSLRAVLPFQHQPQLVILLHDVRYLALQVIQLVDRLVQDRLRVLLRALLRNHRFCGAESASLLSIRFLECPILLLLKRDTNILHVSQARLFLLVADLLFEWAERCARRFDEGEPLRLAVGTLVRLGCEETLLRRLRRILVHSASRLRFEVDFNVILERSCRLHWATHRRYRYTLPKLKYMIVAVPAWAGGCTCWPCVRTERSFLNFNVKYYWGRAQIQYV
jgi:hypothetical protein